MSKTKNILSNPPNTVSQTKKKLTFLCQPCMIAYETTEYWDNPVFLADKVTKCPVCDSKNWTFKESVRGLFNSSLGTFLQIRAARAGVENKYSEYIDNPRSKENARITNFS